mmetsp:Transcript_23646/g.62332  ORF Transcript_23646/g.62332 Transcript_23646/m.62332 type:complete len:270 (-) Transcript_23646:772-1581(-)
MTGHPTLCRSQAASGKPPILQIRVSDCAAEEGPSWVRGMKGTPALSFNPALFFSRFSLCRSRTFLRMYLRQAGMIKLMTIKVIITFTTMGLSVSPATASTPVSKHCSQEKPTRILMELMTFWVTFCRVIFVALLSSILSSVKMTTKAMVERQSASMILPSMLRGPAWITSSCVSLCESPRAPKRRHQEKALESVFVITLKICDPTPSFSVFSGIRIRTVAKNAKKTPAPKSERIWCMDCTIVDGSRRPSLFGRIPVMANLTTETIRKDA